MSEPEIISPGQPGTATPANGNPASPAPAGGQPAQADGAKPAAQQSAQAQPVEISTEELLQEASFKRSPEEEAQLLQSRYQASSKEAKRLTEQLNALRKALADEQGIEPQFDKEGKYRGLKATEKYSKELPDLSLKLSDLTEKEREQIESDPEKAVEIIASKVSERAKKALTRVAPTIEKVVEPLSDERLTSLHDFMASKKDATGNLVYPDYAKDRAVVDQYLANPGLPQEVRDVINTHPSIMLDLIAAKLAFTKQRLISRAQAKAEELKKKQDEGLRAAELAPAGNGKAVIATGAAEQAALRALRDAPAA